MPTLHEILGPRPDAKPPCRGTVLLPVCVCGGWLGLAIDGTGRPTVQLGDRVTLRLCRDVPVGPCRGRWCRRSIQGCSTGSSMSTRGG